MDVLLLPDPGWECAMFLLPRAGGGYRNALRVDRSASRGISLAPCAIFRDRPVKRERLAARFTKQPTRVLHCLLLDVHGQELIVEGIMVQHVPPVGFIRRHLPGRQRKSIREIETLTAHIAHWHLISSFFQGT
jgi:hypothetical protein